MLSTESRQLTFAFADSPKGGKTSRASDVSEGKRYLLHQADVKEASGSVTRTADTSRLLELAASTSNLAKALLNVARNKGAAGVDGRSATEVVEDAPRLLPKLRHALLTGTYYYSAKLLLLGFGE